MHQHQICTSNCLSHAALEYYFNFWITWIFLEPELTLKFLDFDNIISCIHHNLIHLNLKKYCLTVFFGAYPSFNKGSFEGADIFSRSLEMGSKSPSSKYFTSLHIRKNMPAWCSAMSDKHSHGRISFQKPNTFLKYFLAFLSDQ